MKLKELRRKYDDILQKGYTKGFTKSEYFSLLQIKNQIDPYLCAFQEPWIDFYEELEVLMNKLRYRGLFHKYSDGNISYIKENTWLLPLVLANNNHNPFKINGTNEYFLCQFHQEDSPSMRIKNRENWGYCFGCGQSFNVISYLMKYENISFKKALDLLSAIYLFDVKEISDKEKSKASFYQKGVLSQEYKDTLMEILEKFEKIHTLSETQILINEYNQILKGIERIRNHEYDPDFVYDEPIRRVYLKD